MTDKPTCNILGSTINPGMSPELVELLEKARHIKMTPTMRFDQKISFVSSGLSDYSPEKKAELRKRLVEEASVPQELLDEVVAKYKLSLINQLEKIKDSYDSTSGMSSTYASATISKVIESIKDDSL